MAHENLNRFRGCLVEFEDMKHANRADAYLGFLTAVEALLRRRVDLVRWAQGATRTCVGESRSPESSSMPRDPRAWLADVVLTPDR